MQNKAFNGFILALSIIGILIAGYLWKLHATPELIPCGRSGGCATVALSPYSRFQVLQGLGLLGGVLASVILMYIQAVVIHAFCKWCLASEVVMAFMLIVFIVEWRGQRQSGRQTLPSTK